MDRRTNREIQLRAGTAVEDSPSRDDKGGVRAAQPDRSQVAEVPSAPNELEIPDIAGYLQEHLGPEMTAYLSGADDVWIVRQWAFGRLEPGMLPGARLRRAFEAARLLVEAYDGETAKAWFFGMNQRLGDEAPAYLLRHGESPEEWRFIVPAAREFVESAR